MVLLMLAALLLPASAARADGGWNADLVAPERADRRARSRARRRRAGSSTRTSTRTASRGSAATTPSARSGSAPRTPRTAASDFRHDSWLQSNRPDPARPGDGAAERRRALHVRRAGAAGPGGAGVRGDVRAGRREACSGCVTSSRRSPTSSARRSRPRWRSRRAPASATLGAPLDRHGDGVRQRGRPARRLLRSAASRPSATRPRRGEAQVPTAGLARRPVPAHRDGLRRRGPGHERDADRHARSRSATAPVRRATPSSPPGSAAS